MTEGCEGALSFYRVLSGIGSQKNPLQSLEGRMLIRLSDLFWLNMMFTSVLPGMSKAFLQIPLAGWVPLFQALCWVALVGL